MTRDELGPVLFAYDGSDLAKAAIAEAARQLGPGREALAVTVWRPFALEFVPEPDVRIDAADAPEVRKLAEQTAARGASLADKAGFRAQSVAIEATPTWKGLVDLAKERDASLIVLGSHGRSGVAGVLVGSVAGAVAAHSRGAVLIVH